MAVPQVTSKLTHTASSITTAPIAPITAAVVRALAVAWCVGAAGCPAQETCATDASPDPSGDASCQSVVVNGTARIFCTAPLTFDLSAASCSRSGGFLSRISSFADNDAAGGLSADPHWWIGASDNTFDGLWAWPDALVR